MGIVKIRLRGTFKQLMELVNEMENDPDVLSISEYYPDNRKCIHSKYGRVYIEYRTETDD